MDENNDIEALRAEVAELRAKAAEQSERIARYESAGSGDILAAIERMEQRLTPPPSKEERAIARMMEHGYTREQAEESVKTSRDFWNRKKRNEKW